MKKEISKTFGNLRKYGYKVINFNSSTRLNAGMKDFIDFCIFSSRVIIFVEVKLGKDKLSEGQKETARMLSSVASLQTRIHYKTIRDLKSAKELHDLILRGL